MKIRTNYYRGIIQLNTRTNPIKVDVQAPNKNIGKIIVEQKYKYILSRWIQPLEQIPF